MVGKQPCSSPASQRGCLFWRRFLARPRPSPGLPELQEEKISLRSPWQQSLDVVIQQQASLQKQLSCKSLAISEQKQQRSCCIFSRGLSPFALFPSGEGSNDATGPLMGGECVAISVVEEQPNLSEIGVRRLSSHGMLMRMLHACLLNLMRMQMLRACL